MIKFFFGKQHNLCRNYLSNVFLVLTVYIYILIHKQLSNKDLIIY